MGDVFRVANKRKGWVFPAGAAGKESACQCRRCKRLRFDPWVGRIPWRRERLPTPVFLPGESPMDRGAWLGTVHGVVKSLTQLSAHTNVACKEGKY